MKQAVIRRTVRKFAEERLVPAAAEIDEKAEFPAEIADEMAALQYFGLEIPAAYGGAGLDSVSCAIVIEEISKASGAMGLCISVHNSVSTFPVYEFGNEAQRQRFLIPMAKGEKIGSFCLTEPNAGSDASSIETTAVRDGDDYILNGSKIFVTNAGVSGLNLIFALTNPSERGREYSVFIVESEREGLEKGAQQALMGMRGNPVCPIVLNDCRVPRQNLLGEEGQGMKIALSSLDGGRIGIGSQALGNAQACLEASVKYAKERYQFGRRIGDFGAIQGFLADIATRWHQHAYDESLTGPEDLAWAQWAQQQGHAIAYVAQAEVMHVHSESPRGVFNRYRREAMAFKRLHPEAHFSVYDFVRLTLSNILSDVWHALHEPGFLRNFSSILWFRIMQFRGTRAGYRESSPLTSQLREMFYYPRDRRKGSSEPRSIEPIPYDHR